MVASGHEARPRILDGGASTTPVYLSQPRPGSQSLAAQTTLVVLKGTRRRCVLSRRPTGQSESTSPFEDAHSRLLKSGVLRTFHIVAGPSQAGFMSGTLLVNSTNARAGDLVIVLERLNDGEAASSIRRLGSRRRANASGERASGLGEIRHA